MLHAIGLHMRLGNPATGGINAEVAVIPKFGVERRLKGQVRSRDGNRFLAAPCIIISLLCVFEADELPPQLVLFLCFPVVVQGQDLLHGPHLPLLLREFARPSRLDHVGQQVGDGRQLLRPVDVGERIPGGGAPGGGLLDVQRLLRIHQQLGGQPQHEQLLSPGGAVGQNGLPVGTRATVGVALRQRSRVHQSEILRRRPHTLLEG
mmetsp:Transcript_16555/g.49542  ORF Transcript_16555/g.49542 Transcript_16555/m.49542 type:complete len:206 (-) Transcript_16555:822-1439(-)